MMKKLSKFINILLIAVLMFAQLAVVKAAGSATINLNAANVTVGSNVEVTVSLSNIVATGGFAGFEAKVSYDSDYLEYVSKTSLANFNVGYTDAVKTISGAAFDEEARMKGSTANVIKLVFKTKKAGKTTVKINDPEVSAGNNDILTVASASKTITISDPTLKSTNANLSALLVDNFNLTPSFDKNITEYRIEVPNAVTSAIIKATPEDSKATIEGDLKVSNLKENQDNKYTITCIAEDGITKKNYTIIIFREKKQDEIYSDDNTLKSLSVSGYSITPNFSKDILEYNITVPNEAANIKVNAEVNNAKAKVEIIGGSDLQVGNNKVEVKVTAQNGTTKSYIINVKKDDKTDDGNTKLDDDATLSRLYIGGYTLSPVFNKNTNVYTIYVGEAVGGLDVEATPTSKKATAEIKGNNGWKYGMNTVTIEVTAESGNKNIYIVNVNRKDPNGKTDNKSNDSYLSDLIIEGANLSPSFDKDVSSYIVNVPYDMEKLDIKYVTSNSNAKVEVIGNEELKIGTNDIQIKVTAEDGSVRIYTINATREAFGANNYLKALNVNGFILNPNFDKNTLEYNIKVQSDTQAIDITAIAENEKAKVEITGNSNFKIGNNLVLIKVTDENGFVKYYHINAEKPESAVMGMGIGQFLMFLLLGLGMLGILILLIVLLKRKKDKDDKKQVPQQPIPPTPIIDFKPEFNFGSRNGTDDDVVYPGGVLNQGNGSLPNDDTPKKLMEADYQDLTDEDIEEVTENLDFFDQTITKDELIAAIREGMETHNADKLRMLLKQDELNKLKKEIKRKEIAKKQSWSDEDDKY